METQLHRLEAVAPMRDLPERGLNRGRVGTIVESLAPGIFEVEFSDDDGRAYAFATVAAQDLLRLFYSPHNPKTD